MQRTLSLVLLALIVPTLQAQEKPQAVRVCVLRLKNNSVHSVNTAWERDVLVKALERTNKDKEVKKGKAPRVEAVPLQSSGEADSAVRDKNCDFVLHTTLTEVLHAGQPEVVVPPPGAVEVGTHVGDSRAYPPDYRSGTMDYELMRAGNLNPWTSGIVSAEDQMTGQTENGLVLQLMDQVALRVVGEIRKPHASAPQ